MRICKLNTTSQIWGSGMTDAQGNYGSTPSSSTTTIAGWTCTEQKNPDGSYTRTCVDDGKPSAPEPDGAPCTTDAVTGDQTCFA